LIANIGVSVAARDACKVGRERRGGEIQGPEHHASGGEVDSARVHDAKDLGTVQGKVAKSFGNAEARDANESAGTGHVVETGACVEVVTTAGPSADGGAVAVAAVGEDVATDTDRQVLRVHRDSAEPIIQNRFRCEGMREENAGDLHKSSEIFPKGEGWEKHARRKQLDMSQKMGCVSHEGNPHSSGQERAA